NFKYVLPFFSTFASLAGVLLGVAFSSLLRREDVPRAGRAILVVSLLGALTVSMVFIRHPLLSSPRPHPFEGDTIQRLDRAAFELRALVPPGEKVFLFAQPMVPYLAGLNAPTQQLMSSWGTLAPARSDGRLVARSGAWGTNELEQWLGRDLQYAVVSASLLQAFESVRPEAVGRMRALLDERFVRLGEIGDTRPLAVEVYRRRGERSAQ